MRSGVLRSLVLVVGLASIPLSGACGRLLQERYEYEEELSLSLDGSATLNVNASIPALVALRGAQLDVNPLARLDREAVRALFEGPGVSVSRISDSRREGRRFVHVRLEVEDVRQLPRTGFFSWSSYELVDRGEVVDYRQVVTSVAARPVGEVGWTGEEVVAFRMHIPSAIPFHNSPEKPRRGNILEWEQPLGARLEAVPLELRVTMESQSILYSTLILFAATILAAGATFALVVWWVARRGRQAAAAESVS